MSIYGAGAGNVAAPLTGTEQVAIDTGGATRAQTTTAAIAALAAAGEAQAIKDTAITTVGAGTLTAAALVGGQVVRTGPTSAFTDTTDTAAAIVTALGGFVLNSTFFIRYKNGTAYLATLAGGTSVTLPATLIVGPFQEAWYYGTVGGTSAAPTVTLSHMLTTSISLAQNVTGAAITALATNGAGTITAAMINGGFINRTTVAAPFTDTTDTAANIIAGNPGLVNKIGASIIAVYTNNSTAVATLAGGTGVTVSGLTTCPPGVAIEYLLTYTAASTITMVGVGSTEISPNNLVVGGATSGQVTITAPAVAGSAALALPPPAAGVIASTTGANLFVADIYRTSAAVTKNANTTPGAVTGLSGAVAVGTYRFRAFLPSTVANGTGGIAYQSLLTTAVLSAMECTASGYTSAAVAVQHTTTATSAATLFTQAAVVIQVVLEGTFTVSTAGTFGLTMCQAASDASNTVALLGGYLELTRIA